MTNYERTAKWLQACGKEPNPSNASVQIGCHLEEFVEFLRVLRTRSDGFALLLDRTATDLDWFAKKLKRGEQEVHIDPRHRIAALDALCDSEVTGNGIAYLLGFDKDAADAEVLASNESKLENGKAVILEGGKIGKGVNYVPPKLEAFV